MSVGGSITNSPDVTAFDFASAACARGPCDTRTKLSAALATITPNLFIAVPSKCSALRSFVQVLLDRHPQPRTLRQGEIALLIEHRRLLKDRERISVIADGRVVEDFDVRAIGPRCDQMQVADRTQ